MTIGNLATIPGELNSWVDSLDGLMSCILGYWGYRLLETAISYLKQDLDARRRAFWPNTPSRASSGVILMGTIDTIVPSASSQKSQGWTWLINRVVATENLLVMYPQHSKTQLVIPKTMLHWRINQAIDPRIEFSGYGCKISDRHICLIRHPFWCRALCHVPPLCHLIEFSLFLFLAFPLDVRSVNLVWSLRSRSITNACHGGLEHVSRGFLVRNGRI